MKKPNDINELQRRLDEEGLDDKDIERAGWIGICLAVLIILSLIAIIVKSVIKISTML